MDEMTLTKEQLETAASVVTGGPQIEELSTLEIQRVVTVGQYLTDRCVAELECRGELEFHDDGPCLPYMSEHSVECILTRAQSETS